ncbi:hypothetical protein CFOL_v3_08548 [Cephalotus follicularis]|uniref:MULE transposase domain-containing protein n=1 Tax=Cephalotus follicularis TaxID=3775 RepID=A0A1Q3BB80_CEPFO|nr:hypothetical protein CFOL_v3_08548 [Cephalotus follicularis]
MCKRARNRVKEELRGSHIEEFSQLNDELGLVDSILNVFLNCEHRMCARHIYANWSKTFRGLELKKLFWRIVKAGTMPEYEELMGIMEKKCPEGHKEMILRSTPHWCRMLFKTSVKCDSVDNNMSKTFNGWILEA